MRISDWSSDVCSSDLIPPRSPRRSAGREWPGLLTRASLSPPECHARQTGGLRSTKSDNRSGGDARAPHLQAPVLQAPVRSEEHTSELQSLMRISYAVFCLKNKK